MALLTALDRRSTIAPTTYNRWLIPPAALAVHLCIGQVYATSVYKTSLVAHFGTSQTAIGVTFSIAIVMLGLSAAVGGRWVEPTAPARRCSWPPASGAPGSSSALSASPPASCGCCTSATAWSAA